ncbi:DUF934 domain-containing protein [Piscinibacter sp.]|uniref:DUF934 domain-containing protein n=1 Tax=Piscinibacter sp. TaxID=1903157 RepID=UPI0039E33F06
MKPLNTTAALQIFAAGTAPADAAGLKILQIANDAEVAELAAQGALDGVDRIELHFPKFTDGRAYSQAVLLRRRYRFRGDLRATGDVLIDLLVHMHRSGFSSAVLAEGVNAAAAERQFARYAAFYQGDVNEPRPLFAREAAHLAAQDAVLEAA